MTQTPHAAPGAIACALSAALLALAASQPYGAGLEHSLHLWQRASAGAGQPSWAALLAWALLLACAGLGLQPQRGPASSERAPLFVLARLSLTLLAALALLLARPQGELGPAAGFWLCVLGLLPLAGQSLRDLAALNGAGWLASATAAWAGLWVLLLWQLLVQAFEVPRVLLPAPLDIALSLLEHAGTLAGDFAQTVLKAVLAGYVLGCAAGMGVAIAIDRAPFLQRGLLPLASLTSTVPLVGVAPIAVMWFGFDWPSKAAVVVLMTFFPALVSTLAGLQASDKLERELMHSYAAGYWRTLLDLRLPTALPFIFGALKVNATLALIGAIVAEFFGSPTAGLGFRIATEAARMNMALVWGAIVVASVTGSLAYAMLVRLERRITFWHPSVRH